MAKTKKKNKKKNTLYKSIKPFIKDNRVLLSILGAAGIGAGLAAAFGTENVKSWIDKVADAVVNSSESGSHLAKNGRIKSPVNS